mmetsp:Transcript_35921/g.36359  ORF Transcript_35921/g.36359 Transcript_35921/m.36359 type:complete len:114 (+) Transcript_35921:374-715(+)
MPPASYENHDLFYHQYDYDPLFYFAEYNQNNPLLMIGSTANNDTRNDTMIIIESEEELQIRKGLFHNKNLINRTPSLSSLEPISESDNEDEEEEEEEGVERTRRRRTVAANCA